MNIETPDQLALEMRAVIDADMTGSERTQWSAQQRIGVSDIGVCREQVRRTIAQVPPSDEPEGYGEAFAGTAYGERVEEAWVRQHPESIKQAEVVVELDIPLIDGTAMRLKLPGHPDLVIPGWGVIDNKTKDGLSVVRRSGCTQQQKWQVTLYATPLIQDGTLPPDATLAVVFHDRTGSESTPHVEMWTYDEADYEAAVQWLGDVVYALVNEEEASKDQPREWCFRCCPFASDCRGTDTDVEGLITDEVALQAVKAYLEATAMEREARKIKEDVKAELSHVNGSTGEVTVRHTWVNESTVNYQRSGYYKLDIKPIRKKKPSAKKGVTGK